MEQPQVNQEVISASLQGVLLCGGSGGRSNSAGSLPICSACEVDRGSSHSEAPNSKIGSPQACWELFPSRPALCTICSRWPFFSTLFPVHVTVCLIAPSVSIDSIREVCEGKQSEIFQRYAEGSFDPNCCFSLYYGEHMASLDLVSGTGEEARTWITGLKYLMAGISDEDSLAKRQRTRDQYPLPAHSGRTSWAF